MKQAYSQEGDVNLRTVDSADHFTDWMYEQIAPHLHGNILEIGSGRGTYSSKIVRDFPHSTIVLSDIDSRYLAALRDAFEGPKVFVCQMDLEGGEDMQRLPCTIDSVFALNVLEHIHNDARAVQNLYAMLQPGGTCVLLVPAFRFLFNSVDVGVGHYRRYTKLSMRRLIARTPFVVERVFFFNFFSMFAWYWTGTVCKRSVLNTSAMRIFNTFVPLFRFFERSVLRQRIGISLVVVLKK